MSFLAGSAQHIGARGSQQDSFGFTDPSDAAFIAHAGFVAIVCDGMGGLEHGELASRTAVRVFLESYRRKTAEESIPDALERSVRDANQAVVRAGKELGAADQVGTTLVAAALTTDRTLYFISVGDSGIFVFDEERMETLNQPHTFATILDRAVSRGTLSKEQALLHPERESLTSFIGVSELEEIDRNQEPWPLAPGDTVMLASDGLFKTLSRSEILAATRGLDPDAWPQALVERTLAVENTFQDNVTVLTVAYTDRPRTLRLPPPAVSVTAELPQKPRRGKMVAAGLIACGLLLAGAGGCWWKSHHAAQAVKK